MRDMFTSAVVFIIYLSVANAQYTINVFYPASLIETSCSNNQSWTMWFNTNSPNNVNADSENASVILTQYERYMCLAPTGIQAQSINYQTGSYTTGWRYTSITPIVQVISFFNTAPVNVDYRVRYCCPTGSFIGTTSTSTFSTTTVSVNNSICGKQTISPKTSFTARIYGGTQATPYSWPWMVFFQQTFPCSTAPSKTCGTGCGSTLINSNYVMTAAHCIDTKNISNILLVGGLFNTSATNEGTTRQFRYVQQVYIHPQWDSVSLVNDIALIRVSTPFLFDTYVQPACLPTVDPQPNDQVVIVGWGADVFNATMLGYLKQAFTKIVGNCTSYWPSVNIAKQICVANSVSGDSICQGDSGGPILTLNNGRYIASGVASYIRNCSTAGRDNNPNVYTRVSAYMPWIQSIVGQL